MRCFRSNNRSGGDGDYNAIGTEQDGVHINRGPALSIYLVELNDVTEPACICFILLSPHRSSLYVSVIHILYTLCSNDYLLHHMEPMQLIGRVVKTRISGTYTGLILTSKSYV